MNALTDNPSRADWNLRFLNKDFVPEEKSKNIGSMLARFREEDLAEWYDELCATIHDQGPWRDGCFVNKIVSLQFYGVQVVLNPNGTYFLNDTSGG